MDHHLYHVTNSNIHLINEAKQHLLYWIVIWMVLGKLLGSRLSWIRVLLLQLVGKWLSTGDVEVDTDWAFHCATNQFDKLSYSPIEVSVRSYFCGVAKRLRRLRPVGQILARNLSRRHLPTFSTFHPFAFPTAGKKSVPKEWLYRTNLCWLQLGPIL